MNIKYYFERGYPYVLPACATLLIIKADFSFINNSNLNEALDGVITMCSLIIGFLGAILPVILGMKNESKLVKYVFEKDVERLFLKYIKTTLLAGILTVLISLTLYFRADFTALKNLNILFDVWFYFVIMFLLLTYRCTSSILELLFTDDTELLNPLFGKKDDSEQKKKDALNEYFGDKG